MKMLKRLLVFLSIFSLFFSLTFADSFKTILLTINSKTVYVNQKPIELDIAPVEIKGRTMVPLRFISEQLGITDILYSEKNREVTLKFPDPEFIRSEQNHLTMTNHQLSEQNKLFMKKIWDLKYSKDSLSLIHDMESGFSDYYGNGQFEYSVADYKTGVGSLLIKAFPESVPCGVKTDLPLSDFSKKSFYMNIKAINWDHLSNFSIAFFANNGWTDYFVLDLKNFLRKPPDLEWMEIILSKSDFKSFGKPSWDSITGLLIRCSSKTALPGTILIDSLSTFDTKGAGFVSLCFDQGSKTIIKNAFPMMRKEKMTGNLFISLENIGTKDCLTNEDINLLHYSGWNIGGSVSEELFFLSDQDLKTRLTKISSHLAEKGYRGNRNFALPLGKYNKRIQDTIRTYFTTIRTNDSLHQPKDYILPDHINSQIVSSFTSIETIQQWINSALMNGDWLILVFYSVDNGPVSELKCQIETFREILEYLNQFKVPVKTFDEAIYY